MGVFGRMAVRVVAGMLIMRRVYRCLWDDYFRPKYSRWEWPWWEAPYWVSFSLMYGVMTIMGRGFQKKEPHDWQRLCVDDVEEELRRRFGDEGGLLLVEWYKSRRFW